MSVDLGSLYFTVRTDWACWKSHPCILSFCALLGITPIEIRLLFHGWRLYFFYCNANIFLDISHIVALPFLPHVKVGFLSAHEEA